MKKVNINVIYLTSGQFETNITQLKYKPLPILDKCLLIIYSVCLQPNCVQMIELRYSCNWNGTGMKIKIKLPVNKTSY